MTKSIIYYTSHNVSSEIMWAVQKQISRSNLPVVSVSLLPLYFGKNYVVQSNRPSIITMYNQILIGLMESRAEVVFLAEHDVLYHDSHYDFVPPRSDTYYFNTNVWRWRYPKPFFITYDHMVSLSGLCAHRELLLDHYKARLKAIKDKGLEDGRNPLWARKWGHEPGKPTSKGGFRDEPFEEWQSEVPNIDIRHNGCMTPEKMTLDSFRHQPVGWREATEIPGWNLEKLFSQESR